MIKPIKAGDLRHQVTIEQVEEDPYGAAVLHQNAFGETNEIFVPFAVVWARVTPRTGEEISLGKGQSIGPLSYLEVEIRYLPGLDMTKQRVNYLGRIFAIVAVDNVDERNYQMILRCTEWKKKT